jgi:hypothetical protein
MAEGSWTQMAIAAKGVVGAAGVVVDAVSGNTHKAMEHNFGSEADGVAKGESSASSQSILLIRYVL